MRELSKVLLTLYLPHQSVLCQHMLSACQPKCLFCFQGNYGAQVLPNILRTMHCYVCVTPTNSRKWFKWPSFEAETVTETENETKSKGLVYCFTLRAFQLCIKLSWDIKTLCSCCLTLCTSGLGNDKHFTEFIAGHGHARSSKEYGKGCKKELPAEVALHSAESFASFFPLCCKFINKMCICDTRARNTVGKEFAQKGRHQELGVPANTRARTKTGSHASASPSSPFHSLTTTPSGKTPCENSALLLFLPHVAAG